MEWKGMCVCGDRTWGQMMRGNHMAGSAQSVRLGSEFARCDVRLIWGKEWALFISQARRWLACAT